MTSAMQKRIAVFTGAALLVTAAPAMARASVSPMPAEKSADADRDETAPNAPIAAVQTGDTSTASLRPISLVSASSPSNGTSDVSVTTVAQNMDRLDERGPLSVSIGAIYASGDFGTSSNTSIWSSALGVRYRVGDWRLTASLPWMSIRSRSTIFTGIDSIPVLVAPDTAPVKRTTDGIGDLTLGAAYTIPVRGSSAEIELSGRAKINTAGNDSRLSSGKNDYAMGIELTRPIGRVAPFVSATYRFLGDTGRYRLRDGIAASAGASVQFGEHVFALASYHYAQSATRLVDDLHEVFLGVSTPLGRSPLRATGFATAGLSHGAAAVSTGIALSLRL